MMGALVKALGEIVEGWVRLFHMQEALVRALDGVVDNHYFVT